MPILVLEHAKTPGSGAIGRALAHHGLRVRPVRVGEGEPVPTDLDDVDGVVSLGGPQSATDDGLPWIAAELGLLQAAVAAEIPVLGVCLGAQLLARALGGGVAPMSSPSVGLPRVDLTPVGREDPLFRGLPWFGSWPSWHREEITEMPPDARLLASSDDCGIEGFAVGISAYGVQFHPEWEAAELLERCRGGAEDLGASVDLGTLAASVQDMAESIDRQADRFATNVASYLMPVERVNRGVAKDIHH